MEEINKATTNIEGLIHSVALTTQQRDQLLKDLKLLYDKVKEIESKQNESNK